MKKLVYKTLKTLNFSAIMRTFLISGGALFLTFQASAQTGTKSFVEMIYWNENKNKCPVCDCEIIEGTKFFIFRTSEVELIFSGTFYKELFVASVFLENKSENQIKLRPSRSVLAVYKKNKNKIPFEVYPITPEQAAKKAKGNANLKNFIILLSDNLAARTERVNLSKSENAISDESPARGFNEEPTVTSAASNGRVQNAAQRKIETEKRTSRNPGEPFNAAALMENIFLPGRAVSGNIYFPFAKGAFMYIGIRVGNKLYVKDFSGVQENYKKKSRKLTIPKL